MPGRTSRSARSSAVSRKSSTQTLRSARVSALAVEIPDEGPDNQLRTKICSIFADAQKNTATQRKLAVNLRKVQERCCYEPVGSSKKSKDEREDFGELEFNDEVGRCVLRVLGVKKSEPVGDRIVKFLGLFLRLANEKDNTISRSGNPEEDSDVFLETPSSRLTTHVLSLVLPMLTAKDKTVRYRATEIIAHIINTLDSIDDEIFQVLRMGLLKRLRDKESSIRVQAVLGLGRLADEGEENDEDEEDDMAGTVLEKLLDVLQNDPAAEVRRSLLLNLPFTPSTLPYLLERARDLDPLTRRALYAKLLPALGDFRHLSLTFREKLMRWGLRDRDEHVRKATARLFRERWIEDCALSQQPGEDGVVPPPGQVSPPSADALLELVERIDVLNCGTETGVGMEAMKEFWDGRPDYLDFITFDQDYWSSLTTESAFIARTFNDYCRSSDNTKIQSMVEEKMPEVTRFAFYLQQHLNLLIERVQIVQEKQRQQEEDPEAESETVEQEFCVEQLLQIALTLDYTDEIGRRKMSTVMREALALPELPDDCTNLVVQVLRMICGGNAAGEREFCALVLEAVAEVHDSIMGEDKTGQADDESFHSAQSEIDSDSTPTKSSKGREESADSEIDEEKAIREIMVNMKCLHIAQCMLQNVQCDLEQNSHLVTMLNNLVVPAVRSQEAPIRERGLTCLGLCCLLSKNLAEENLTLFLHCFIKGHEALQKIALEIITDMLITHPSLLAPPIPANGESEVTEQAPTVNPLLKPLTKSYLKALTLSAHLSLTSSVAISKLLLLHILPPQTTADVLKSLLLTFFNPETASNPGLRQVLSYFLPVYCHSRRENAAILARVIVPTIAKLVHVAEEAEEDEEGEWVGWTTIVSMLADWTDSRKLVDVGKSVLEDVAQEPHVSLAEEILARVQNCTKDERKPLLSLLSKLHIPAPPSDEAKEALVNLTELVTGAIDDGVAPDATTRTGLIRLQTQLSKIVGDANDAIPSVEADDYDATTIGPPQSEGTLFPEGEGTTTAVNAETTAGPIDEEEQEGELTVATVASDATVKTDATATTAMTARSSRGASSRSSTGLNGGRRGRRPKPRESEESVLDSLLESEIQ